MEEEKATLRETIEIMQTSLAKAQIALVDQGAEIRMLAAIIIVLCSTMSPQARQAAIDLISKRAELEPKHVVGDEGIDRARLAITKIASHWIAILSA